MTKNLVPGMALRGSKQVLQPKGSRKRDLAAAPSWDPKRVQNGQTLRSNWVPEVPPRSVQARGTNRHILAWSQKVWSSGGLKMRVKIGSKGIFLTDNGKMVQNWLSMEKYWSSQKGPRHRFAGKKWLKMAKIDNFRTLKGGLGQKFGIPQRSSPFWTKEQNRTFWPGV